MRAGTAHGPFSILPEEIERVGKLAVVVLATLFALGLLTTNAYLLQFGVSEFNLLRARFVLTGFLTLIPVSINLLFAVVIVALMERAPFRKSTRRQQSLLYSYGVVIAGALLGVASPILFYTFLLSQGDDSGNELRNGVTIWSIGLIPLVPLAAYWIWRARSGPGRHPRAQTSESGEDSSTAAGIQRDPLDGGYVAITHPLPASLILLCVLVFGYSYVSSFAEDVYPLVPEQFGGGKPRGVQILFAGDAADDVTALGVPLVTGSTLSQPVSLLWQGDRGFVVRIERGERETVVLIDESLVSGVIVDED